MALPPKYFVVDADALPEIFRKVAETKRLLEVGEANTVHQATGMTGISRSAFYKYKDAVRPFNDMLNGRIVTFQFLLRDEPGVLSAVLNAFAASGGNILTINQNIPSSGCALVTIGAETSGLHIPIEELVTSAGKLTGVVRCEVLAG
ncbi:MAG: ACT domain-containing protein [Intestinimonas sp.]|nr:ACT domain-containing protein [Intestinimonas sp.]